MAALTADRNTHWAEGDIRGYKVAASTKIYAGSLVALNASGYAVPGADTASFKFLGVAHEYIDNSSGANGDKTVTVRRKGIHRFAAAGMAITNIGDAVYLVNDQTVGLAATTTNDIACGKIAEFISATEVGVDIDK
jgi:hypothetical protein